MRKITIAKRSVCCMLSGALSPLRSVARKKKKIKESIHDPCSSF